MPSASTARCEASSTATESSLLLRARPVSVALKNSRVMVGSASGSGIAGRPGGACPAQALAKRNCALVHARKRHGFLERVFRHGCGGPREHGGATARRSCAICSPSA
jgi:hypothetical protein